MHMWLTEGDMIVADVVDDTDLIKWMMSYTMRGTETKKLEDKKFKFKKPWFFRLHVFLPPISPWFFGDYKLHFKIILPFKL